MMNPREGQLRVERMTADGVEGRAEAILQLNQLDVLDRPRAVEIEAIVEKEVRRNRLSVDLGQDLGLAESGQKIIGRCVLDPPAIFVDRSLTEEVEAPRFRFTLAHEYGHFILHRNQPEAAVGGALEDTKQMIESNRTETPGVTWTPEQWREWQARKFAAALLVPRRSFRTAVAAAQTTLGWQRNLGTVYVDGRRGSQADRFRLYERLGVFYRVSPTVIKIRLVELGLTWGPGQTRSPMQEDSRWNY